MKINGFRNLQFNIKVKKEKMNNTIKFYPVDNGDTVLIKLSDHSTILLDCQFRDNEKNSDGVKVYNVKEDLLKSVEKDTLSRPFVDLFINSHPHEDHCLGFEKNFFLGNPDNYKKENFEESEIIIGELWVTQMVFTYDQGPDALAIRREVVRRKKLFEDGSQDCNAYGNRLRIIGYNEKDTIVEGLHYIPGEIVSNFNGKENGLFSIFIHSPFKSSLVQGKAEKDKNQASIIFQAIFRAKTYCEIVSRAIFGGDSDHYVWQKVLETSKNNGNEDKLIWDLFLAPHHCSWSYFNDVPYKDNPEPKDYSTAFLDYGNENAFIVASSKEIKDNDVNPPHYKAKLQFEAKVGAPYFRNTGININVAAPEPLEFIVDEMGLRLNKAIAIGAASIISTQSKRAG